eukprot:gene13902-biopygen4450
MATAGACSAPTCRAGGRHPQGNLGLGGGLENHRRWIANDEYRCWLWAGTPLPPRLRGRVWLGCAAMPASAAAPWMQHCHVEFAGAEGGRSESDPARTDSDSQESDSDPAGSNSVPTGSDSDKHNVPHRETHRRERREGVHEAGVHQVLWRDQRVGRRQACVDIVGAVSGLTRSGRTRSGPTRTRVSMNQTLGPRRPSRHVPVVRGWVRLGRPPLCGGKVRVRRLRPAASAG